MKYFISFTEEFWPGQKDGTWIGRMEYRLPDQQFPDEMGFGSLDRAAVEELRAKYDFTEVDKKTFDTIVQEIERIKEKKDARV